MSKDLRRFNSLVNKNKMHSRPWVVGYIDIPLKEAYK